MKLSVVGHDEHEPEVKFELKTSSGSIDLLVNGVEVGWFHVFDGKAVFELQHIPGDLLPELARSEDDNYRMKVIP